MERAVGIVGELALGRRHAVTQPNHAGRSADAGGSAAAGALLVGGGHGAKPNLKLAQGEALAVVLLLLGDPPLLAGGERGEDDAADPHGRYLRSGGAMILTFMEAGASAVSSLEKRFYDLLRAFRERPAALGFRKSLVGSPQSSNRLYASRIAQKPQNSQNRAAEGLESVRRPRAAGSRHQTPPSGAQSSGADTTKVR